MSASSGLKGACNVCGHMYNEHNRDRCNGTDKKKGKDGKKKWVRCKNWWYICQQAHAESESYQICHNCPSHPGGGPPGTELGGTYAPSQDVQQFEAEWEWDTATQRYFYRDDNGNVHWDDQGQSSTAGQ